jgi:hypothetical protein
MTGVGHLGEFKIMKRIVPLSLIGSAIVLCLAASSGQAAVPGVKSAVPASAHASVVTEARWFWHRRRCWWSHHHRHCR